MAKQYNYQYGKSGFYKPYRPEKDRPTGLDAFEKTEQRLHGQGIDDEKIDLAKKKLELEEKKYEESKKKKIGDFKAIEEVFNGYAGQTAGAAQTMKSQSSQVLLDSWKQVEAGTKSEAEHMTLRAEILQSISVWNATGKQALESYGKLAGLDETTHNSEQLTAEQERYADFIKTSNNVRIGPKGKLQYYTTGEDGKETLLSQEELGALTLPFNAREIEIPMHKPMEDGLQAGDTEFMGEFDAEGNFNMKPMAEIQDEILGLSGVFLSPEQRKIDVERNFNNAIAANPPPEGGYTEKQEQAIYAQAEKATDDMSISVFEMKFNALRAKKEKEWQAANRKEDKTTYKKITKYTTDDYGFKTTPVSARSGVQGNPVETVTGQLISQDTKLRPTRDADGFYKLKDGEGGTQGERRGVIKRGYVQNGQIVIQMAAPTEMDINDLIDQKNVERENNNLQPLTDDEKVTLKANAKKEMLSGSKAEGFHVQVTLEEAYNIADQIEGFDLLLKDYKNQRETKGEAKPERVVTESFPPGPSPKHTRQNLSEQESAKLATYNKDQQEAIITTMSENDGWSMEEIIEELGFLK